jgi:hypothetical protein
MLLDLLPPPSDCGNLSLLHYVVPILPNTSSLIEIAFHQTTLSAWVSILLHQFQNFNLSEPILTTCRVVSILPVVGASTIRSHPPYQLPGHMRTPQLLYSALRRSEVFTLPLVFQSESDWTAWTPRTVLGLSSDYSWLRGLPNISCESEPVQAESVGLLGVFGQSADQTLNRVRPRPTSV